MIVKDLNIDDSILELFNFTLNDDAKACLKKMVSTQLQTKEEVITRQQILKGFLANYTVFENYSYSKIDFRQVYIFLENFTDKQYLLKKLTLKLKLSKKKHYEYRGKCVQLIMLYSRLHNHYIKHIETIHFPEDYKKDIRFIDEFFYSLRLNYYENLIRENKFKIKHIVQLIQQISDKKKKLEIDNFQQKYTLFEAYISVVKGTQKHKFSFPEITDKELSLSEFYHPLLAKPIKNSFSSKSNVILLTGANMSGKSTLLKAIGISVYLGNIGFAIPATTGKLPKYDNISVHINLNDDMLSGYSHFMTEVMNLKNVVTNAGSGASCFAVFDELFRGTNIDDALEISKTTLKGLINFPNSIFFISSHLHQLTEMKDIKDNSITTFYLDCELQNNIPVFTYKLKPGWSDIKIGRILFDRENLNSLLNYK